MIARAPSEALVWDSPPGDPGRELSGGQVHVWRISIDPRISAPRVLARRSVLTDDERARADRFYTPDLATRWLLGRSALRSILGRYTGVPPSALALVAEAHGKPAIDPTVMARQPSTLPAFNLTHAGELALLAVSRAMPLGIDVERVRAVRDASGIAERFFSPVERDQFRRLDPDDRDRGFFRCWTRKEAFIKAIGEGLSRPLATFDVDFAAGCPARLRRIGSDPAEAAAWWMAAFEPAPDYLAAVAARTPHASLTFYDFDAAPG